MRVDKQKTAKEDRIISIAIMSYFVVTAIQYFVLVFFDISKSQINTVQLISKGIVGLFYIYAFPIVIKRSLAIFVNAYAISFTVFILNYLVFPDNWTHLKPLVLLFFFTCLPSFLYSYSIFNWEELRQIMRHASTVVFIVGLTISILIISRYVSIPKYSMSLSYYMLFPAIFSLNDIVEKINWKAISIFSLSVLSILSLGSRGAILCIVVFIFARLLIAEPQGIKMTYLRFTIVTFVGFVAVFYQDILRMIVSFLSYFGVHSRSIEVFLTDLLYSTGRDEIYAGALSIISKNSILGVGLAGDRRIIGLYVHNIFLEILINFGVLVGLFVIFSVTSAIILMLRSATPRQKTMLAMWMGIGFVQLLVSSSYINNIKFWILMGLMFSVRRSTSEGIHHIDSFSLNYFSIEKLRSFALKEDKS